MKLKNEIFSIQNGEILLQPHSGFGKARILDFEELLIPWEWLNEGEWIELTDPEDITLIEGAFDSYVEHFEHER